MYVVNRFRYVGTDETHTKDEQVSDQVIMLLLKMYLSKGRNVTIDNYFTSMKLTSELQKIKKNSLLGTVKKIRKVPAVATHMKEPLHSPTLYKSVYATITVHQGKANKNVVTLSTLHPASAFLVMPRRSQKRSKLTMTPNMVLMLSIKWQGNTRLELTPVDRLCIRSTTLCGYKRMVHLQGGHKEDHTQKSFSTVVGLLAI